MSGFAARLYRQGWTPFLAALAFVVPVVPVGAQTIVSGTISTNTTWTSAGNPYWATGGITVNSGATLTVGADVVVKFDPGAGISLQSGATLDVQGTSGNEVYFTSIKDDAVDGNDTGGDGATSPAAGDWAGINIADGTSADLDYLEVRYPGSSYVYDTQYGAKYYFGVVKVGDGGTLTTDHMTILEASKFGLVVWDSSAAHVVSNSTIDAAGIAGFHSKNASSFTVQNSTIQNSVGDGVVLRNSSGTLSGNAFSNNGGYGLNITGTTYPASITGNTFSSSGSGPITLDDDATDVLVAAGNTLDGPIHVTGTSSTAISWSSPFVYMGSFAVGNGSTLTIPAGQIAKFGSDQVISVLSGGTLDVQGTSDNEVHFTSFQDDTVGGDTNGDGGGSSPAARDWGGISIADGGSANIDYLQMRYAGDVQFTVSGSKYYAGIYKTGNSGTLNADYLMLLNTGQWGIAIKDSSAANVVSNSTIDVTQQAGFYLNNVTNITVLQSTFQNCGGDGFYIKDSSGSFFGNTVHSNSRYGFYLTGATTAPTITDSTISSNLVGVYCTSSANPVIGGSVGNGNDITGNASYGVQNTTSAITVDATYNWWGDASGPQHPTTNPSGTGDTVSDSVDYGHFGPELEATPDPLEFGESVSGSSLTLPVTVQNVGGSDLEPGAATISGTDVGDFSISDDGCDGQTLEPADTCMIDVTFTPSSTGSKSASLDIASNDPDTPITVALTGEGVDCLSQPSGLVSWWRGEYFPDDYMGVNDGSETGGAGYAAGHSGQSFDLGGANDYIEISDDPSLQFGTTDAMTIEFWAYRENAEINQHLVGKGASCATFDYEVSLNAGGGGICFEVNDGSGLACSSGGAGDLPTAQWSHIAGTYDGSTLRIYIDGQESGSSPGSLGAPGTSPLRLGTSGDCGVYGQDFDGRLDEVRIYDRALSATEVARIHSAGGAGHCSDCTDRPADLVSWWQAEDDADDFTGTNNGADGGVGPAVTFSQGQVGQAFDVTGANDYIEVPDDSSLQFATTDPMTIDLWAYRTSADSIQSILGKRTGCSATPFNYELGFYPTVWGGVCFLGNDATVTTQLVCSSGGASDLPLNTWTHIAGTFDGSTLRIYLNGQEAGSNPGSLGAPDTSPLRIGTTGDCAAFGHDFDGLIDEVEIHDRALSQPEIDAIYDAGSAGKCEGIDRTPDQFAFMDVTTAALSSQYTDSLSVSGLGDSARISIDSCTSSACDYQVNGGGFTSATGLVDDGDTVEVRQTSSAAFNSTTELQLTIGGVSDVFGVTTLDEHSLTVTLAGNGAGGVTSSPSGIACPGTCSTMFAETTTVTLTPSANTGSSFSGWSGDGDCTDDIGDAASVSMAVDVACTATFTLDQHTLTVSTTGNGSGTVTSSPGGIACIIDCDELYDYGTAVTLTPAADTGYVFGGWTGAATPADDDCYDGNVTITSDLSCVASFVIPDHLDLFKRNLPDDGNTSQTYAACLSVTAGDEPGGVPPVIVLAGTSVTLRGGYVVQGKNELMTEPTAELTVEVSPVATCPSGDCTNAADALVLATGDMEAKNGTCVATCPEDDTHDTCVADCLESALGLGGGCASCFGTYDECVLDNCPESGVCAAPSSDACLACKETSCNPELLSCAGLSLMPF